MRSNKREADIQRRWDRGRKWLAKANYYAKEADDFRESMAFDYEQLKHWSRYEKLRAFCLRKAQRALTD